MYREINFPKGRGEWIDYGQPNDFTVRADIIAIILAIDHASLEAYL
jgi:hypothetical protein